MKRLMMACLLMVITAAAYASAIDVLADKLADKGFITQSDALQIKAETKKDGGSLPLWIKTMTFGGDMRLRVQSDSPYTSGGVTSTRVRGRIRVRFGMETAVTDNVKLAAGITTGTAGVNGAAGGDSNPATGNHTFQAFNKPPLFLDYAYISYMPAGGVTVSAGKVRTPMALWNVTDLIWDYGDINPDGAALNLVKQVSDAKLFANAGYYILNQQTDASVGFPAVYIVQPGVEYAKKDFSAKAAASYQYFSTRGKKTGSNSPGSWLDPAGGAVIPTDYELLGFGIEVKRKNLVSDYTGSLFCQLSRNMYDKVFSDNRNAFAFGFAFGDNKLGGLGTWTLLSMYRRLERNAAPLGLGYPDAYLGRAGKGFQNTLALGLVKNMDLTTTWYDMTNNDGNTRVNTLQFNLNYKF